MDWPAATAAGRGIAGKGEAAVVAAFSRAVSTSVVATPCLVRSIALAKVLRGQGLDARVEIGMRRMGDRWEGHAWVERAGRIVIDEEVVVRSFVRFERAA
jgi:hypothetical protein